MVNCRRKKIANTKLLKALLDLGPLEKHVSLNMLKKMVAAGINYQLIVDTYKKFNFSRIKSLLGKNENGIVQVTESKLIVEDICNCLEGKPKRVT